MGPWMDGCVPDSIRNVPGRRVAAAQVSAVGVVAPGNTSVENDCTRVPCTGGVTPGAPAMGHVTAPWALAWLGLGVEVAVVPRPPPNWPTITSEVGTVFVPGAANGIGVNERLFVRLIVRACPVGTVITTGDHMAGVVAAGFNGMQLLVARFAGT